MTPNAVVEPSNISVLVIATKAVIHPTTRTCMESINVQVFLRAATSMPSLHDTDTKTATLIAQNTPTDYAASKEDNRQMQAATNFNADQQMHAATNFTADKADNRTNQVNLRTFPLVYGEGYYTPETGVVAPRRSAPVPLKVYQASFVVKVRVVPAQPALSCASPLPELSLRPCPSVWAAAEQGKTAALQTAVLYGVVCCCEMLCMDGVH